MQKNVQQVTEFEEKYYKALEKCGRRYLNMIMDYNDPHDDILHIKDTDLYLFICEFITGIDERKPLLKLNRWLGYIQGQLIAKELTTVNKERNITRGWFRPLDFPDFERPDNEETNKS